MWGPARLAWLRAAGNSGLGKGSLRFHGKDGPVSLHEDALGMASQDEFADL